MVMPGPGYHGGLRIAVNKILIMRQVDAIHSRDHSLSVGTTDIHAVLFAIFVTLS